MISSILIAFPRRVRATLPLAAALLLATPAAFAVTATPSVPVLAFPATAVGASSTATMTFSIAGFNSYPGITTHYSQDYAVSAYTCDGVTPTETCSLTMKFTPTFPGARKDAIFLSYNNTRIATVLLAGVGNAPLAAIQPGLVTMPPALISNQGIYAPVTDENGTLFFFNGAGALLKSVGGGAATVLVANASTQGPPQTMGLDGAGVLYYGAGAGAGVATTTTINTYDTVQNIAGTITIPASDAFIPVTVDAFGNLFAVGRNSMTIYRIPPSGAPASYPINPAEATTLTAGTDAAGNFFVAGANTGINELTPAGVQSQITTRTGTGSISFDAAGTLYTTLFSFGINASVPTESPASNYNTVTYNYPALPALGISNLANGNLNVGAANNLYFIDRTQGALAFGTVQNGATAPTQTLTLLNVGNQPLTYSSIAITGTGFALQTASTSPCTPGIVLAAGASCNLAVNDTAPHPGVFTGSVTLTSNSLNAAAATQSVALSATTPGAYLTSNTTSIPFSPQVMGTTSAPVNVTVTNNGTVAATLISGTGATQGNATYTVNAGTCTGALAAGSSCTFNVTFTPYSVGSDPGTVTLTGPDSPYATATLTIPVTGAGAPLITQTGGGTNNSLLFNPAAVAIAPASAQTLTATFTVNGYSSAFTPTAAMHYGTSYTAGAITCTGPVTLESCSVPVTFVPQYPGARRDALIVTVNGIRIATIQAYGIGQSPLALLQPGIVTQPIASGGYYYNSVVGEDGTAYVLGQNTNTVYSITKAGVVTQLPIGVTGPSGIAIDGAGTLYIAQNTYSRTLVTYTSDGVQGSFSVATPLYTPCTGNSGNNLYPLGVSAGIGGDLFVLELLCNNIYDFKRDGTVTVTAINPAITQPDGINVDSAENVFIGGYTINELTAAGVQTQINSGGSSSAVSVDAAGSVYATRYTNVSGVALLPATNYSNYEATLDSGAPTGGAALAPDGTFYVGNYTQVDKVDRSRGLFTFNSVNPLQPATPQTATFYNGGNTPLTLTSATLTGDPNYTLTANSCTSGVVIQPGALCSVTINFTAPHNGMFTGAITFVTNSLNTPTTTILNLTDTVTGAYLTATPTTLNFGTVPLNTPSAPMTILVTNTGGSPGTIQASDGYPARYAITIPPACTNLAINASCTISVLFTPNVSGPINTTGNINATGPGDYSNNIPLTFTGTGGPAPAPIATLTPASLSFNPPINTTSAPQIAQLSNTGNAPLILSNLYVGTGNSFFSLAPTQTSNPCTNTTTLAAGTSCNIAVTFTTFSPTNPGPYTGSVTINDNAASQPQTLTLTGTFTTTPQAQFSTQLLSVIAGTGTVTTNGSGDSGTALAATFNQPFGVVQDPSGNLYVSDSGANYVRRIAPNGTITQYAGLVGYASHGFSGDAGPAITAQLNGPQGLAVDASGNLYIADEFNGRVRVVNAATGVISTYAGTGAGSYTPGAAALATRLPGPVGLAFDPAGNLYIAMGGNASIVVQVTPFGTTSLYAGVMNGAASVSGYNGDNILATAAELSAPMGIASDQLGNLYIADNGNSRVRKVTATTGRITTFAGTGVDGNTGDTGSALNATVNPYNLAVDLYGEVFIAGANAALTSFSVRKVAAGIINTVAGGGTGGLGAAATSANFNYPLQGIAIDNNGSLLIATNSPAQLLSAGPTGLVQFPPTPIGTTTFYQLIGLENTGNANLTLTASSYTATGPFAVTGGNCDNPGVILAAGNTCNFAITFTPTAATQQTGTITIPSNGSLPSQTITLLGTGTPVAAPQVMLTPAALTFNAAVNTTTAAQLVTLSNTGSAPLTNIVLSINGSYALVFNIASTTCTSTLAAGASCTANITYSPNAAGTPQSAAFNVADSAANSPQSIPLTGTATGAPVFVFNPNAIIFGNQTAATTSAAFTSQIYNTGNATLNISAVTLTGANTAAFAIVPAAVTPCGATLAPNTSCNYSVTFTPPAAGSFSASLTVTSNSAGSPQSLPLTGTGTTAPAPAVTIAPAQLSFSTATGTTSANQTIVITNSGNAALTGPTANIVGASSFLFNIASTSCTGTLAAGASCNVVVNFTPSAANTVTATLTLADNAGNSPQTVVLTGTGTTPQTPVATLSPLSLNFTATTTTPAANQGIVLSNTGTAALTISSVTLSGANPTAFALLTAPSNPCAGTLAAGATCNLSVGLTANTVGTYSATVLVADNATPALQSAALTGTVTGIAQATFAPAALNFPATTIATTSSAQTVTLTNSGTAPITGIGAVTITGAGAASFAQTTTCAATLAPGAACAISVTFTPSSVALFTATLSVTDSLGTQTATLSGTGTPVPVAQAVLTPATVAFPTTNVGTASAAQTLTLSNPGTAALAITGITFTGANPALFTQTNTCGASLAAAATCTISVVFTPTSATAFSATINVADAVGTQTATLTGSGNPADFTVAVPAPSQSVDPGGLATYNINVAALTGNYNAPVTLTASGLPPGAAASFAPATVVPGAAGAISVLSIQTSPLFALEHSPVRNLRIPAYAVLLLLPFAGIRRKLRDNLRDLPRAGRLLALLILSLAALLPLSGCAGGYFGAAPQSFTITVTGSSGTVQHNTTVTLTIQ